ncbi:MAG: response regulator [Longimicrobiales bacterium]
MTAPEPLAGLSVVLVSDDLKGLRTESAWLEEGGATVHGFQGAAEAVLGLTDGLCPHVIMSDLHMKDLDAWQLSRLIRTTDFPGFTAIPILIVSAHRSGPDVESISKAAGATAFLPLPTSRAQLIRYMAQLTRRETPEPDRRAVLFSEDRALLRPIVEWLERAGSEVLIGDPTDPIASCARSDWVVWDAASYTDELDDLLEALSRENRRAAVIVLSDDVTPSSRLEFLVAGADAVVPRGAHFGLLENPLQALTRERALARVEEALRARGEAVSSAEHRYELLFDAIPDMVLLVDQDGTALAGNVAAHRSLAGGRESLSGLPLVDAFSPSLLAPLSLPGSVGRAEGEVHTLDAGVRSVEVVYQPIGTQDGPMLAVFRDVTDRLAAEQRALLLEAKLLKGQKLESLGVMASGVAHDFNNLLLSILGNAALAAEDVADGGARTFIDEIALAAERAAELTGQILAFSGQADQTREPLELTGLVQELGRLLGPALSKNAHLHIGEDEEHGEPCLTVGDAVQIRQVFMNLLVNASDALGGEPGDVRVLFDHVQLDGSEVFPWIGDPPHAGAYVSVEVQGSGQGMDPETLDRIFDPFFTTKFTGKGLGLAAALGTIGAHGGGIYVVTAPGEGSRFTVLLPEGPASCELPDQPAAPGLRVSEPDAPERPPHWRGMILVVDDEAAIRGLVSSILERAGYEVVLASDGAEALRVFEERRGEWACVLLDTVMPVMDGDEAFRHLRVMDETVPVVMTSGNVARTHGRGRLLTPDAWIQKPYRPADLRAVLDELVDGRGAKPAAG